MFSAFEDFGEPPADGQDHAVALGPHRRSRRGALWLLAAVVVIVAVTVALVRLVDTGPGAPSSPAEAASRYIRAVAAGQDPAPSTTCAGPAYTSLFTEVQPSARVAVSRVQRTARDHWTVSVRVDSPPQTIAVQVERHRNRYVVC